MMKKLTVLITFMALSCASVFAQFNLEATKAAWIDGVTVSEESANKNGVYPVLITWDRIHNATSYSVYRGTSEDSMEKIGLITETAFIDANGEAVPNQIYLYRITAHTALEDIESETTDGWGALTIQTYMLTYNQTMYTNHPKFILMNKKNNLAKLGKEEVNGTYGGTCFYQTKLKGLSGIVMMKYTNYSDHEGWTLNGYANVKASITASGMMFGTMIISGMYPGIVCYDNIEIKKGNAGGGYYTIEPEGFDKAILSWDQVPEEIIANEELEKQEE